MAASSLICFLNLFNSIRGRMEERRGEFAVLKSIGMTNAQIRRMLLQENLGILAKSIFYGG
ncbi:FtsX-like permease family protein, partial [Acinetobacter baumannii]|nr:FtsX-like permease family protein [Acinetobacter baumannii]